MIGAQPSIEPLEPDAGNAAEGSEVGHAISRAWLFVLNSKQTMNPENRKSGRESETGGTRAVAFQNNGAAVAGVGDPGSKNGPTAETAVNDRGYNLPNSRKIYVAGKRHADLHVPFREISLAPTKTMSGEIEVNEPVRVYDTSGPWGDADADVDVTRGLRPLRAKWIRDRGDVEEINGRKVQPIDDGYLSEKHAVSANGTNEELAANRNPKSAMGRRPLRASADHPVTQLWYARQGIITPEMEFIAIRENGRASNSSVGEAASFPSNGRDANSVPYSRNDLRHQHVGESF